MDAEVRNSIREGNMYNYTGHFIDMENLLQSKNSFLNRNRYFDKFLQDNSLRKKDKARANIFEKDGKNCYFIGADTTYWWGFNKKVIKENQNRGDYLIARGAEGEKEFFIVIPVQEEMKADEGRIIVSAGGSGKDFWLALPGAQYVVDENNSNNSKGQSDIIRIYYGTDQIQNLKKKEAK